MNVRVLTRIAILAAMAWILMLIEIRLPGFPIFLKYDLSDIPALVAAFTMGPVAGLLVEVVKDLLKGMLNPGDGGWIGAAANLLAGGTLVYVAGLTRQLLGGTGRSVVRDVVALITGAAAMAAVMLVANAVFFLPLWGIPKEQLWTTALVGITPFNLVKGALSTVAAVVLSRPLYNVLGAHRAVQPAISGK